MKGTEYLYKIGLKGKQIQGLNTIKIFSLTFVLPYTSQNAMLTSPSGLTVCYEYGVEPPLGQLLFKINVPVFKCVLCEVHNRSRMKSSARNRVNLCSNLLCNGICALVYTRNL